MTQFDLSKLNVDMSQLAPSPGDMITLVEAFKETVRGTYDGNRELLHSLCAGIGEVRLRGVCRRLSTPERAEMIDLLLPDIEATSGKSQELVQRLMDTAPNLSALHDTFDTIGFEKFDEGPAHKWFGERAALAKAVDELQGFAFLVDVDDDPARADEAIGRIAEVLNNNAQLFEENPKTKFLPLAFNAATLRQRFNEQRWEVEDPVEFARAWNERIKIHTTTGLGVYDSGDLMLSADELRDIREGLERFPAYVLTLENVLLRIDFCHPPAERDGALGGYDLGRIVLFDSVREARAGLDYPAGDVKGLTYTIVHETSHGAHTVGMMDFQKISGWIRVNDLKFTDPITNVRCAISKDEFSPGEIVKAESGRYVVSEYWEAEKIVFPMHIEFENPYNTSETGYLHREGAQFVTEYASTTPEEDYAETLTMFLLDPERLGLEFQK
jgi:hypothetical protein